MLHVIPRGQRIFYWYPCEIKALSWNAIRMIWNSSEYVTEHAGIADNIIAFLDIQCIGLPLFLMNWLHCRFYPFSLESKPIRSHKKPSKEEDKINNINVIRSIIWKPVQSIAIVLYWKKILMICRIFFIRFFNLQKLTLSLTKYEFCTPSLLLPITS